MCDKSWFVQWQISLLLAQARPMMMNHHTCDSSIWHAKKPSSGQFEATSVKCELPWSRLMRRRGYLPGKWKALKCQTLGTAVHVIVLVCWLEIDHCLVTHTCHAHCFCACVKFAQEFLTLFERLAPLIFSFPSWFHTIWFYCSHAFHSFLSQITLCSWSKDMITPFTCLLSYRYSSFTLWAYLCWGHTYSLTANDQ